MSDPIEVNGKHLVPKDPDDIRFYWFNFTQDLTDTATTPHESRPPIAICAGVSLATHPDGLPNLLVMGMYVRAYLGGFDMADNAPNFCTVRLQTASGEQIDRTMWFVREDH